MMPPLVTRLATNEGKITDDLIDWYLLYARGGVGIIITEAVSVKKQKSGPLLRLNADEFVPGLRRLTERVHAETEGKIAPQLIHFMKISKSGYRQRVEDLTADEIREIPDLFSKAAKAREAGFDSVELHFAHAYIMSSFLSRHNHRTDAYGGSLKNRLRLSEEVVNAVRKSVGDDCVLGARMNGDEFTLGENTLEQSRPIALRLAELGLDYLSISAGGKFEDAHKQEERALDPYASGYGGSRAMPPAWMPEKVNVYLCSNIRKTIREKGHKIPVVAAGRIPTAQAAEEILQNGELDMVAIARPILCDPYWPKKYKEGRDRDVQRCTYYNQCRGLDAVHQKVFCS